jgi:predicted PurR-regulated permease PerM
VFTLILVDNLMYLRLAGDRMQLHEVPALVALLGGLSLFGVSGIILGPVTLAVAAALLEVWKGRSSKFD